MSIYATLWNLKFPRFGDWYNGCEWVEVVAQGVPAHVGTPTPGYGYEAGDPYHDFLPPAIPVPLDSDEMTLRAVVIVTHGTKKEVQQYIHPLLVLPGAEYEALSFQQLCHRICAALQGDHPRLVAERINPDGSRQLRFRDGSTRVSPREPEARDQRDEQG